MSVPAARPNTPKTTRYVVPDVIAGCRQGRWVERRHPAALGTEIVCRPRYKRHYYTAKGLAAVAERIAIESYRETVQYLGDADPTTRRLFEEVVAVEEQHADELLSLIQQLGEPLHAT